MCICGLHNIRDRMRVYVCPSEDAYACIDWSPRPVKRLKRADGTWLKEGPPPDDTEGKREHYERFCSLVWVARLQHNMLHDQRDSWLKDKALKDMNSSTAEHQLPGAPHEVDVIVDAFDVMLSTTELTEEDVTYHMRVWQREWEGTQRERARTLYDREVSGLNAHKANARARSRFDAMLNNDYGSRKNCIHFMVHGAYLLDERKLPPPRPSTEYAADASAFVEHTDCHGRATASSGSRECLSSRGRYLNPNTTREKRVDYRRQFGMDVTRSRIGLQVNRTRTIMRFVSERANGSSCRAAPPTDVPLGPSAPARNVRHHVNKFADNAQTLESTRAVVETDVYPSVATAWVDYTWTNQPRSRKRKSQSQWWCNSW
jgi:hypothetical protein